jgi:hypothetical protein
MRYLDYAFAWAILLNAVAFMLAIEILHLSGAILDVPFLWLLIAILNFLRLRNGYARVPGIDGHMCRGQLCGVDTRDCALEAFRKRDVEGLGPYTFIAAVAFLG